MIIRELSEFHDPRALETWSTARMLFQKYMAVNEKMSPPFVILQELLFLFVDTCFHPTAAFCCWLPALRESLVWTQHLTRRRPHMVIYNCREVFCTGSLLALRQTTYLIVFLPKCECQFTRWSGSTKPHHSSSDTPRTEIFGLHTTVTHENAYIEPQAQRWKTHITRSTHSLPVHTCACPSISRHPREKIGTLLVSLPLSLSLSPKLV